jgi:hypothetical protein
MASEEGSLALAWGILALRVLNVSASDFPSRLAGMQGDNGSWNDNSYHTAMALLATRGLW